MQTAATSKMKSDVEVTEIADLKRQIADLKVQMTAPEMYRHHSEKFPQSKSSTKHMLPEPGITEWSRDGRLPDSRPRLGYCFRCREDGHLDRERIALRNLDTRPTEMHMTHSL